MGSLSLKLALVVRDSWRLLDTVGEADLLDRSIVLLLLLVNLLVDFLSLSSSTHGNQSLMLLSRWGVWSLWGSRKVTVGVLSRLATLFKAFLGWINQLVVLIHVLAQAWIILWLVEVEWLWSC